MFVTRKTGKSVRKLGLICLIGLVFYNECFIYFLYSFSWPSVECGDIKEPFRLLLVADPQILGEETETWIARWDADRFLRNTFSLAVHHVRPHIVIFLGDLMDEGNVAGEEKFYQYYTRFKSIFKLDRLFSNMTIFLPGDNDIGGENEAVSTRKLRRFNSHFGPMQAVPFGNYLFVKFNKMSRTYPDVGKENSMKIILSHIPLLGLPSLFASEAVVNLKPTMIFSAHDHHSVHFVGDSENGERTMVEEINPTWKDEEATPTWRFQTSIDVINEIVVPTCSYRMGVEDIGYGMAILDQKGEAMCYSVLWLPQRLFNLYLYLIALPALALLSLIWMVLRCRL